MDRLKRRAVALLFCCTITLGILYHFTGVVELHDVQLQLHAEQILTKCRNLHTVPAPPADFSGRTESDRFVHGTRPTLLKNATMWTGRNAGMEVVHGDLLLDGGIIKSVGAVNAASYGDALDVIDVGGAWISPGIIDMHSHMGVAPAPVLTGAQDVDSHSGSIHPWLRSIDGLNTHDESYMHSIAGGLTTALILPGSESAIGGQAFVMKPRPTSEKSPSSMLLEPPVYLNGSEYTPPRWRQMKHACGETPAHAFGGTRMDNMWDLRTAYNTARILKKRQDSYCEKALGGHWNELSKFPEDLKWEALVDVLRGRVKIHNHCYEAVDIDGMVRLTNEFKFSIASFHHAHETYLVPDLLKKAYGGAPASALFALFGRYKREAYRHSEFAPRILADAGLDVVMKTDHPLGKGRYLLYEAQVAHHYGLPAHVALSSVTSTPARIMGMNHRIGSLVKGNDADVVVWDSHPLALGATPKQVYIDGIPQLDKAFVRAKPKSAQSIPVTPDFTQEMREATEHDGTPPLEPKVATEGFVVFHNVGSVYVQRGGRVVEVFSQAAKESVTSVYVENGTMLCHGLCADFEKRFVDANIVDLEGGSIAPGIVTIGTDLGLVAIDAETSTADGVIVDVMGSVPSIVGEEAVIRAVDGLQFQTREALLAYRAGVTTAVVPPQSHGFIHGLSVAFSTGAKHKLEGGAVVKNVLALHLTISLNAEYSVSTMMAALRRLLSCEVGGDLGEMFDKITKGMLTLVISVHNADIMASLIGLKAETEQRTGVPMRMTFVGATESHLIAAEIAQAGVGVIVGNSRSFPLYWEQRRILEGPPIAHDTTVGVLLKHNITTAIGIDPIPGQPLKTYMRYLRFDAAWAALEMDMDLSVAETIGLVSANVAMLLGMEGDCDLVATTGGTLLQFESKVVGVVSSRRGVTDLF